MPAPFVAAAKRLLGAAADTDATSVHVAAHAVEAFEQLANHLSQFIGVEGVRALLARSAALSSATYPWLADTMPMSADTMPMSAPTDAPFSLLQAAMEQQAPPTIRAGFATLLSTFFGLLGRLVGEGLVDRVLHEIWPEVFPLAAEEPT